MVRLVLIKTTFRQHCVFATVPVDVHLAALQGLIPQFDATLRFAGVRDALCVWRCIELFVHDPRILVCQADLHHPLMALRLILVQLLPKWQLACEYLLSCSEKQGSASASMASSSWAAFCSGTMAYHQACNGCYELLAALQVWTLKTCTESIPVPT